MRFLLTGFLFYALCFMIHHMWYFVGLGNPGKEYEITRHNTGRDSLLFFARKKCSDAWKANKKLNAQTASVSVEGGFAKLVLPDTFMNKSGQAVLPLVKNAKQAEKLVVVHDDLDLPLGVIKISFGRGSGGHKGVDSIMRALKTKNFVRIRIGISPATPSGKLKKPQGEDAVGDFILGKFKPSEQETLKRVFAKVCEAFLTILAEGRERAMNECN